MIIVIGNCILIHYSLIKYAIDCTLACEKNLTVLGD